MKKTVMFILIALILMCCVSCSKSDYTCYYGYFSDTAFALIYSNAKNTLYYVKFPLNMIVDWGMDKGIDSVPEVIRNFAGLKESGFMLGNEQTFRALKDILDAMSQNPEPDTKSRLEVIVKRNSDLINKALRTNISRLCSSDITNLLKAVNGKNADVAVMDADVIFKTDNLQFSQQYFQSWMNQIIN